MEIKLDKNQWHVRLYFWCRKVWNVFRHGSDCSWEQPNLCTYIRTIFIYAPLTIAAHLALIAWTIYVLVIYPVAKIGWVGFGYEVLVVAILASIITGYVHLKRKRAENQGDADENSHVRYHYSDSLPKEKKIGLIEVIYLYLEAAKQKVCPMIEFTNNKE